MMFEAMLKGTKRILLVPVLLSGLSLCTAQAPSPQASDQPPAPTGKSAAAAVVPYRYLPHPVSKKAREYYALIWGVDSLSVRSVESGEIIRFSYRVLDAKKAIALNDKKNEPSLIDPRAGVKLVVPSLEKVGKLRQSSTPAGHRVNVVIGNFRADGLVVQ